MSTLLLDELYPGVTFSQKIKIFKDTNIKHIRPWVYIQGDLVDGDFQLEIKEGNTSLSIVSIGYAKINAFTKLQYSHGFIRFDFKSLVLRVPEGATEKEYTFEFSMINHTRDASNYLSIVRRWEDKTYVTYGDVINGEGINDSIEPAGLEIYEYSKI